MCPFSLSSNSLVPLSIPFCHCSSPSLHSGYGNNALSFNSTNAFSSSECWAPSTENSCHQSGIQEPHKPAMLKQPCSPTTPASHLRSFLIFWHFFTTHLAWIIHVIFSTGTIMTNILINFRIWLLVHFSIFSSLKPPHGRDFGST